jgi:hypothetical protein
VSSYWFLSVECIHSSPLAGTGKTTAARLIAEYLHAYGVLPTDTVVEMNATLLKGQFVGQSAPKLTEAVKSAMGGQSVALLPLFLVYTQDFFCFSGVLFLDEAYGLAAGSGDSYAQDIVRTMLTEVENNDTDFVCILAGYEGDMAQLMKANQGLGRRFRTKLVLENYSPGEIVQIAKHFVEKDGVFKFSPGLMSALEKHIQAQFTHEEIAKENGGLAKHLAQNALASLRVRCIDEDIPFEDPASLILTAQDFGISGGQASRAEMVTMHKALVADVGPVQVHVVTETRQREQGIMRIRSGFSTEPECRTMSDPSGGSQGTLAAQRHAHFREALRDMAFTHNEGANGAPVVPIPLEEFKAQGNSVDQCAEAGYTAVECMEAGYPARDLYPLCRPLPLTMDLDANNLEDLEVVSAEGKFGKLCAKGDGRWIDATGQCWPSILPLQYTDVQVIVRPVQWSSGAAGAKKQQNIENNNAIKDYLAEMVHAPNLESPLPKPPVPLRTKLKMID